MIISWNFKRSNANTTVQNYTVVGQSVMSNSLWPHGLQHIRLPHPSLSPWVFTNSCSLSQWCHPTISSSFNPFSSCPQSNYMIDYHKYVLFLACNQDLPHGSWGVFLKIKQLLILTHLLSILGKWRLIYWDTLTCMSVCVWLDEKERLGWGTLLCTCICDSENLNSEC